MKVKTRTFFETSKRFLSPILESQFLSFQQFFKGALSGVNPFIHVFFIQGLVGSLELSDKEHFLQIFMFYIGYIFFYELIDGMTYNWGWFRNEPQNQRNISQKYMRKFINLDNNAIERIGSGKMISIFEKGAHTWSYELSMVLWNGGAFLVTSIISLYIVFSVSSVGGFLFIFLFIIIIFIANFFNSRMIGMRRLRTEQLHLLAKHSVKMIMSKIEILQNDKINKENSILGGFLDKAGFYNMGLSPYFHGFYRVPMFFMIVVKILLLWYLAKTIFLGDISIATFVGVFGIMTVVEQMVMRFIQFYKEITRDFVFIEHFWNFFDSTPEIQGYDTGKTFKHISGDISLKNISYGYDENLKVFDGFSLDIPGNKIIALVGPSGGGKSTLVKLISGYIRQDSGDILVDCQNLKDVSLKSYYKDVGYLTQEPSVFDGTVIENLLYAVETENSPLTPLQERGKKEGDDYSRQRKQENNPPVSKNLDIPLIKGENETQGSRGIDEIIKLAHCEFIYDLPNGLETEIGERGVKLSGGQKQRLAIAKIFLKDPKIIILDEPTSALDSLSEQKITEAMHNLFAGRTVLIIAHRLQTVKHANEIIVIDSGKVVERGTHNSLVRKNGYYKQMLDLQSGF